MNLSTLFARTSMLLLFISVFSACGDDATDGKMDGEDPPTEGFTINENVYNTPNAYLIYESSINYDIETMMDIEVILNRFQFSFTDGTAISHDGKILYSEGTTNHITTHRFRDNDNTQVLDDISGVVVESITYTQAANSGTRVNMSSLEDVIMENGISYGNPVFAGINYPLTNEDTATFKINSLDIDYTTMSGTIDCEYSISPSWEGAIIGRYSGSFDILID